ncbi:MAG: glucoamylase family protein [Candidatus Kaelpia aquatica]|nr:glucoamylase family protein [Candidatus Kaelpia aquatica]
MRKISLIAALVFVILIVIFSTNRYLKVKNIREKREQSRQEFQEDLKPIAQAEVPGIFLLSHFNEKENKSSLGDFGAWDKAPNDYSQSCYDSFSSLTHVGDSGYSLRIDYDVDSPSSAFNGVWFDLGAVDLSQYKQIVIWAKGDRDKGYTKDFKLEVQDSQGKKGAYYITGLSDEWREYTVDLDRFVGALEWGSMRKLVIVFEDWKATQKEGTIYVDDIYFTAAETLSDSCSVLFPTARERIPKPDMSCLSDQQFLELIQRKAFGYFWNEANPDTGLIKDKANNFKDDNFQVASIAAVGFALSSYPIAVEKGWISKEEALERTLNTLFYFRDKLENVHGFFYHFVGMDNGKRVWNCELSSIDTALFLAGALAAGEYFGSKVRELAEELYERVEWDWMLAEGDTLCMGWMPETGFLPDRWNRYGEQMLMYLFAIGSPTYPISPEVWDEIRRPIWSYEGYTCLVSPPLFTHQYSHIWVDFRNKHDDYADYFQSSVNATLANREFCINNKFNSMTFNENSWGLTACESPAGYDAYGAPPGYAYYDGTVAFTALGGSIPFAPRETIAALRWMYSHYKDYVWGRYGFSDSLNRDKDWYSEIVIGIDQGAMLLMIENYLTGSVWDYFMSNKYINKAMDRVGFKSGTMELEPDEKPLINADYKRVFKAGDYDYTLKASETIEHGAVTLSPDDLDAKFSLGWDEESLYFWVEVTDNEVVAEDIPDKIYKQDSIEIYIAPENKNLRWGNEKQFQLGFAPSSDRKRPLHYAWFQDKIFEEIRLESKIIESGYILEIAIPFEILGIEPEPGLKIGFSIAVNDFDKNDNTPKCKYNLFFMPYYDQGCKDGFELAEINLVKE